MLPVFEGQVTFEDHVLALSTSEAMVSVIDGLVVLDGGASLVVELEAVIGVEGGGVAADSAAWGIASAVVIEPIITVLFRFVVRQREAIAIDIETLLMIGMG